eukprot:m.620627 g.620627  ORF g.620627 m.620627 type:complete len:318 (+) comp22537_c0_seq4:3-956(+)
MRIRMLWIVCVCVTVCATRTGRGRRLERAAERGRLGHPVALPRAPSLCHLRSAGHWQDPDVGSSDCTCHHAQQPAHPILSERAAIHGRAEIPRTGLRTVQRSCRRLVRAHVRRTRPFVCSPPHGILAQPRHVSSSRLPVLCDARWTVPHSIARRVAAVCSHSVHGLHRLKAVLQHQRRRVAVRHACHRRGRLHDRARGGCRCPPPSPSRGTAGAGGRPDAARTGRAVAGSHKVWPGRVAAGASVSHPRPVPRQGAAGACHCCLRVAGGVQGRARGHHRRCGRDGGAGSKGPVFCDEARAQLPLASKDSGRSQQTLLR